MLVMQYISQVLIVLPCHVQLCTCIPWNWEYCINRSKG